MCWKWGGTTQYSMVKENYSVSGIFLMHTYILCDNLIKYFGNGFIQARLNIYVCLYMFISSQEYRSTILPTQVKKYMNTFLG